MIVFKSVKWKNLLSYGDNWTEIQIDAAPSTLIVGKNGGGKSGAILDSITYALFGKAFRKINKAQLINSINEKDMVVELEFEMSKKHYRIVRGQKPNIFEIYINGKMLDQDSRILDQQTYLEKNILRFNYKSFTQVVVVGGSTFTPFMRLNPQERRIIIEDILDICIFSSMNTLLKQRVNTLREQVTKNQYSIDLCKNQIDIQRKFLEDIRKTHSSKIDDHQKKIKDSEGVIKTLNEEIDNFNTQIMALLESIPDEKKVNKRIDDLTKIESKIEDNIAKQRKSIEFFRNNDTCPTCKQSISSDFKTETVDKQSQKLEELTSGLETLNEEFIKTSNRLSEIKDVLTNIKNIELAIQTRNNSIQATNQFIANVQREIEELKSKKTKDSSTHKDLANMVRKLSKYEKESQTLAENKSLYAIAGDLLKDTGIKTRIIRQYLPVMNKLINKYLSAMDFFVNFNLDENFDETIKSRHLDEFSYSSFSEGEKRRIDLALLFTWRAIAKMKNSLNTNLLVLDEILDGSIDSTGMEDFFNLIATLPKGTNIFVISHRGDLLDDKFHRVIKFDKVKNFSRIVETKETKGENLCND